MNGIFIKTSALIACLFSSVAAAQPKTVGVIIAQFDARGVRIHGSDLMPTNATLDQEKGEYVIKFSRTLTNTPFCQALPVPYIDASSSRKLRTEIGGAGATKTEVIVVTMFAPVAEDQFMAGRTPFFPSGFVIACAPTGTATL